MWIAEFIPPRVQTVLSCLLMFSHVENVSHVWELLHAYPCPPLFNSREKESRRKCSKMYYFKNNYFLNVYSMCRANTKAMFIYSSTDPPISTNKQLKSWSCRLVSKSPLTRHDISARQFPTQTWGRWTVFSKPMLKYEIRTKSVVRWTVRDSSNITAKACCLIITQ